MRVVTPVWLVGMMGAGKSSVGLALARRLGCAFVDTDSEIERNAALSVAEIFERQGEAGFRALERRAVAASAEAGGVVALGGGALADPEAAATICASGTIVYLRARPETLLARVGDAEARPLLAGLGRAERLARLGELLADRQAAYAKAALQIDTDDLTRDEVVEAIVHGLNDGD